MCMKQMHYVLVDAICAAANWGDAVLMRMSSRTPQAHLPAEIDAPARVLLDYMVCSGPFGFGACSVSTT